MAKAMEWCGIKDFLPDENGLELSYISREDNMKRWAYNASGFNRYGLLRDDCLDDTDPDVIEALRRLPPHVLDERAFRQIRAIQLDVQRMILPKDEWTKIEEDVLYLTPMVNLVIKERLERECWEKEY